MCTSQFSYMEWRYLLFLNAWNWSSSSPFLSFGLSCASATVSFFIRGLPHYFISCDKMTKDYSWEILNTEPVWWDLPSYVTGLRYGWRLHISYFSLYCKCGTVADIRTCGGVCMFVWTVLHCGCLNLIRHH